MVGNWYLLLAHRFRPSPFSIAAALTVVARALPLLRITGLDARDILPYTCIKMAAGATLYLLFLFAFS